MAALVFPQVGAAEGVEYTSRSFTYHHASLAQVDDHHDGVADDYCDLQVVEAAVMSAKASPVMEEVGEIISSSFFKLALTMSKMRKKYLFF